MENVPYNYNMELLPCDRMDYIECKYGNSCKNLVSAHLWFILAAHYFPLQKALFALCSLFTAKTTWLPLTKTC